MNDPSKYKYNAGDIPPEQRLPNEPAPAYADKKALKRAIKEHREILLNLALNKTLFYWKKLINDDELLENLPLKAIRAAADTRGVSSEGKRDEIIMRIETSVLNEEESIYIDEIERIELAERDLEAMGSVYTFGNGDVGQLGLGGSKLISSSVPIVIPQLRAVGVTTVRAGLDTDIFMGVTDKQEVVVWGNGRGVPFFGLKPQEMVDLELLTPRAGPEFDKAVKRDAKKKKRKKKKNGENNDDDDEPPPPPPPDDKEAENLMSTYELLEKKRAQQKAMALRGIATNRTVGQYGTHEARRLGFRSRAAEPISMDIFHEENVVDVSIGKTHATAWTANGDLYVWGLNGHYQCGLQNAQDRRGDPLMDSEEHKEARLQNGSLKGFIATRSQPHTSYVVEPALNRQFKSNDQIKCASCWGQGTAVVLRDGRLLGCGLSSASSVNLPMMEHLEKTGYGGIIHKPNPKLEIFREPRSLRTLGVRMVSCGSNHCLCVTTQTGIMSWGCGSGGKLGHGNNDDVPEPKRIKSMMNDIVLQVACGIWHSIAVILVAPLFGDSGWVCSFGTGTKGQLGLGSGGKDKFGNPTGPVMFSSKPLIIEEFRQDITVRSVAVGCNHNIALTNTNEMYSWGSNKCGALGRPKSLGKNFPLDGYSDKPAKVEGFSGWGKGPPAGIACGPSTSCVALYPWDGPDEQTWLYEQAEEKEQRRRERERRKREEEERKAAIKRQREHERIVCLRRLEKYHPLCSICVNVAPYTNCFGFWPDTKRPMQCGSCGHERSQHRAERKKEEADVWTFDVIMEQEKKVNNAMEEAGATMVKEEHPLLENGETGEKKVQSMENRRK